MFCIRSSKGLIYARVEPIIDPLRPADQIGFRHRKSTMNQVVLQARNVKDCFEAERKAGGVLADLTAAYDSI